MKWVIIRNLTFDIDNSNIGLLGATHYGTVKLLWNLIIEEFYGSFYGSMPVVDVDGQSPTKPYQPKLSLILNFMI